MNLDTSSKYLESYFEVLHNNPPEAFNKDYNPRIGEIVHKAYSEYCEAHPDATRQERKDFYANTSHKTKIME